MTHASMTAGVARRGGPFRRGLVFRVAAHLALVGGGLGVALLVGEAGARLFAKTGPALLVSDPVVGKKFLPGYAGRTFVPECGCEVDLRFDRDGLRGPDRPEAKPPGVRRLVLLGDSMIASVATREEATLARRLEDRLGEGAARWEVRNAGVSSSSTGTELVLYREVLSRSEPDVVLLAFYEGNDLADNSPELTHGASRLYFELDGEGSLRALPFRRPGAALGAWLDRHSRLYVWQKTAIRQLTTAARAARSELDPGDFAFADPEPPAVARAWRLTAALVSALRDETAVSGTRLGVVAIPPAVALYDDLWSRLSARGRRAGIELRRDAPDERLGAICRELHLPFLSLTPDFAEVAAHRDSTRLDEQLFIEGRYHWNERGNAVAADAVLRFLHGSGLISSSPGTGP
jgi:hypothetical protein